VNRQQIIDAVRLNIGGRTDKDEVIEMGIDLGLEGEIGQTRIFQSLVTIPADVDMVVDQDYVNLPSGTVKVLQALVVDGTSSFELVLRPRSLINRLYPAPEHSESSTPQTGFIMGSKLYLRPIPDEALAVRFSVFSLPSMPAKASGESSLAYLALCLIQFATFWVFQSTEFFQSAREWRAFFESSLRKLVEMESAEPGIIRRAHVRGERLRSLKGNWWDDPFQMENP